MKKRKRHLQQKKFITMDNNSYAQLIDDFEKGLLVIEGESLTDYITRMGGVDYDAKANGGIMGYAIGGRTRNLSDVYDNSSVLQDKYSTQQDYLDLFDQSTTTTPTTSTTTITDLIEQAPETMLPPRVRPLLIPQGGDSSDGGITNIQTPQKSFIDNIATPGVVTDSSKANQNFRNTAFHTYGAPVEEEENFLKNLLDKSLAVQAFKKAKVGLTKGRDFAINLIEQRQAAKELAEQLKAANTGYTNRGTKIDYGDYYQSDGVTANPSSSMANNPSQSYGGPRAKGGFIGYKNGGLVKMFKGKL